jgi:hypothetical protein
MEVLRMLDKCAKGHSRRESKHSIVIKWQGGSFPLPSGRHGRTMTADIGTSQVRGLVRQLGISTKCADKMLPPLAGSFTV